jgi:hypothetical protein
VTGRRFPDGYRPLAYCRDCGRDFAGDTLFDRHRVGAHGYTLAEGLRHDPPVEGGRRCLDDDELRDLGLRPMTDEEMRASRRDRRRAGLGVELWFDPAEAERARRTFAEGPLSHLGVAAEATGMQLAMDVSPAA